MGGDWRTVDFADVVSIQRGHDLPAQAREKGDVPIMGSAGLTGWHVRALAPGPGVTIGRSGASAGAVSWVQQAYWPHNTCLYVTDFRENNPRFIFYWLRTLGLERHAGGSAQPSLNRNHLSKLKVSVPAPAEQEAIAELLGALDDKIELNQRMAEILQGQALALFKSWFVDFDPVRAKAEGRPTGLADDLAALFPATFGENGLPKGWLAGAIDQTFELLGGGTPRTSVAAYWDGCIPWFSVTDAPKDSELFVLDTERRITPKGLASCAATLLPEGATIITARGTVGKLAMVGIPMAMNQSCYAARAKPGFGPGFVFFALQHAIGAIRQQAHGSVFDTITRQTFANVKSILPNAVAVDAFETSIKPTLEKLRAGLTQTAVLTSLRDTLLPKLISGELRIRDAEQAMAAA